jgi:hypothetical protein
MKGALPKKNNIKKIREKNKRKRKENHDKKSKKQKLYNKQTGEPEYLDIDDMTEKCQYCNTLSFKNE